MKAGVKQGVVVAAIVMGLLLSGLFEVDSGQVYAAANPGKVTSMSLNVTAQPQANLKWGKATGKADGYTVVRNGKKIAEIKGENVLAYVDESLKPGKSYTYKVMPYRESSKGKMIYGKASPVKKVLNGYTYKKGADGFMTLTGYTGRNEMVTTPAKIGKVNLPKDVKIAEGAFYGSRVDGIMPAQETFDGYVLEDGVLYTGDMKTLIAYFPKKVKNYRTVWSSAAKSGELTAPEGVERSHVCEAAASLE